MSRNTRRRNNMQATFKDYLVPIIGWVFILILIWSMIGGGNSETPTDTTGENRTPIEISFGDTTTEASIEYPGNVRETITGAAELFKGEMVVVKEGNVLLSTPEGNSINLNKIAEFKYLEDGSYALFSSDAWLTLTSDASISLPYANVSSPAGSIIALTQNEAASTVYVVSGSAKVTNLAGVSTLIVTGQKVSVARQDSRSEDVDLASEKTTIDSYFKGSDWFIENNGHVLLTQAIEKTTENPEETTNTDTTEESWSAGKYVSFDNLSDEMNTNKKSLNITGTVTSDIVGSITINNSQASISTATNTFALNGLTLRNGVNDLVIKIYDTNKNVLEKTVYTVYTTGGTAASNSTTPAATTNSSGGTTYQVDATEFSFTEPSVSGKFSTTASEITIRGATTAKGISKVQVNGFTLSSFNGSTWRYHAFERFETLEAGTNQYRIDYFGEDGNVVYTDYFTIVKKAASPAAPQPATESKTISNEATISS